jgi:hypothetical protein
VLQNASGHAFDEARRRLARLPQGVARVGAETASAQKTAGNRGGKDAVEVGFVVGREVREGHAGESPLAGQKLLLAFADEIINVESDLLGEPQARVEGLDCNARLPQRGLQQPQRHRRLVERGERHRQQTHVERLSLFVLGMGGHLTLPTSPPRSSEMC